jgi:hypothetical protein
MARYNIGETADMTPARPAPGQAGPGGAMDNQSPEMEKLSHELRVLMRAWVEHPDNEALRTRYKAAHAKYQEMLMAWKKGEEAPETAATS